MIKKNELKNLSVSHATLRPQDLIESFTQVLKADGPQKHKQIIQDANVWLEVFTQAPNDDNLNEEGSYLLEDLFAALDSIAPSGYYFGAHPGDGSDFGFWEVEEF